MKPDLSHVSAKGSSAVVVLAVNVIGNGPANRDEPSARCDRKKPSPGEEYIDNIGKADTILEAQHARRFVKAKNAVESTTIDQFTAAIETRIAIAAAEAIRKQRTGDGGFENLGQLVVPRRPVNTLVHNFRVTAPRKNSRDRWQGSGLFA